MKKLKILVLIDVSFSVTREYDFSEYFKHEDFKVYTDITQSLIKNGHEVKMLGIFDDLTILLEEIRKDKPDIVFNLADNFNNQTCYDKNIAGVLEMLGVPHTGASQAVLLLCNDKGLSKTVLGFRRIKVPGFRVFYKDRRIKPPKRLRYPLIVKPLSEEASRGIAQDSFVGDEEAFISRVKFIHENMRMDAIAEEYIPGREFYVSMFGDKRVSVLPIREVKFINVPDDEPNIATYRAKWDEEYRKKWGIKNVFAGKLPEGWEKKIKSTCKRAYKAMNMKSYARFDVRVTDDGQVYIIEPNANPSLDKEDEFVQSAFKLGLSHEKIMQKIVDLGLKRE